MAQIAVIGSGIIGMTTALSLAKAGHQITVISKDKPAQTTSAAAAALWFPFKAEPQEKVANWSVRTLAVFKEQLPIPEAGIVWTDVYELATPETELPWWSTNVENFSCDEALMDLPAGKRKVFRFTAPIIDTGLYLQYLENELKKAGVKSIYKELKSFDEAFDFGDAVINCAGIGARELANDTDLRPARGQVLRIKRRPNQQALFDVSQGSKLVYIIPRIHDTIIGGTYDENVFDLEPDTNESNAIVERCQSVYPQLEYDPKTDFLGTYCGLRPVRSSVRVEKEIGTKPLFHNYGHGGSGYTIAWGCAEEICTLVAKELSPAEIINSSALPVPANLG